MVTVSPSKTVSPLPSQVSSLLSNITPQLAKSPRPPSGGRGHDFQRSLGESERSGSRLLQSPFPGGKGFRRLETRDRPLSPQQVCKTNSVQYKDCLLSPPLSQRGRLPSIHRPERCLLPDPHPSLLPEVALFHLRRDGPPVQSSLLRVINRPTGLHTGVRYSVGLGPLPRSLPPQIPGRLAGPGLLGGQARLHVRDLLLLCHSLRIVFNDKKSELTPSRSVEYLGMTINTVTDLAFPTAARIDKLLSIARMFLAHQTLHAQLWQVLLGHMSLLEKLVPRGRLRMRSLQWHLKAHWSPETDPPCLPVPRSWQVEEDLAWWMVRTHLLEGRPFGTPAPDLRLYSGASRSGWGGHLLDQSVSGIWSQEEASLHINLLEMKALFLALQAFRDLVTDHQVTAMCDNSTVVAYVNKQGGTVSDSLCSLTGQLLRWSESSWKRGTCRGSPTSWPTSSAARTRSWGQSGHSIHM